MQDLGGHQAMLSSGAMATLCGGPTTEPGALTCAKRPVSFRWPKEVPPPVRVGFETLPLVASDGRCRRGRHEATDWAHRWGAELASTGEPTRAAAPNTLVGCCAGATLSHFSRGTERVPEFGQGGKGI